MVDLTPNDPNNKKKKTKHFEKKYKQIDTIIKKLFET